jgi:hypothetical protein
MSSRTHYLGVVYAPDEKSAEAAAIAEDIRRPNDDWAGLAIMDTRRVALLAVVGLAVIAASFFLSLMMFQLLD